MTIGTEASGPAHWFERLLAELHHCTRKKRASLCNEMADIKQIEDQHLIFIKTIYLAEQEEIAGPRFEQREPQV